MGQVKRVHDKLTPPSGAYRWMNCAASGKRCAAQEERAPSKDVDEGSRKHGIIEDYNRHIYYGQPMPTVDHDDHAWLDETVTAQEELIAPVSDDDDVMVEHHLDLSCIGIDDGGTADLIIVRKDAEGNVTQAEIYDYKFGRAFVSVDSPQMTIYAIGVAAMYPSVPVRVGIIAPYFMPVTQCKDYTPAELDQHAAVMRVAVQRVKDADIDDVCKGAWCHYCEAQPLCPAHTAAMGEVLAAPVDVVQLIRGLPEDERTAYVDQWYAAAATCKKAIAQIEEALQDGTLQVPEYYVTRGRKLDKWVSEAAAIQALQAQGFDPPMQLATPAAVRKACKGADLDAVVVSTMSAGSVKRK